MKTKLCLLLIPLVLACFALLPIAQAAPSPTNVNVVNPQNQPALTRVVNDVAAPVPTKDIDNTARHSFTATASDFFGQGSFDQTLDMATVPQGKRLVVEQVSAEYVNFANSNFRTMSAALQTTTGGVTTDYMFKGAFTGIVLDNQNLYAQYVASSQMRSYADAGTTVRVIFRLDYAGESGEVRASLSGYLIDVP